MGYRSDVAYVIKFADIKTRDTFVALMLAKNDKHITEALDDVRHDWAEDPIITYRCCDVKWYPSFDDVKAHHALMGDAVELYGARYRFLALGEDGAEDYSEEDNVGDLYDYVSTVHELHTSF